MTELNEYFIQQCWQGLKDRGLDHLEEYRQQLQLEIDLIIKLDFPGYFLIVADIIKWARANDVAVGPGRGSAAGALTAYALGITDVDPLKYRLYFERFLNPDRVSPPDIDMDFAKSRRDDVIAYLKERYGEGHVAQIATFGKLFAKQAIRDAGRVMDLPYQEMDSMAKLVPPPIQGKQPKFLQAYESSPELKKLRDSNAEVLIVAEQLEGLEKLMSSHAAGVVISDEPLLDCLPLSVSKGTTITQFDMKDLDDLGFIKFDILALKNLDVIADCVKLIKEHQGIDIDWRSLPEDEENNPDVFSYLREGRYGGIFQLEATSGMKELILEMQPRSIEDLSLAVALFRPGPLGAGMKDHYLAVRQGREQPSYLIEELKPILEVTLGQLIYQEQVLEICKQLAGYTLAEADLMRRAIGKKIAKEMEAQHERFVSGMEQRGFEKETAQLLWSQIETHAGYGFNKAHSVAYAFITYITAYLKYNYRLEFYVALLNNTKEAAERPKFFSYLIELREEGFRLLPPDINSSQMNFSIDDGCIRYGLSGIRHIGENVAEHILSHRGEGFRNLRDLVERVDSSQVNVRVLEALAFSGCLDAFHPNRRTLAENCRTFLAAVRKLNFRVPAIETKAQKAIERAEEYATRDPKKHGGEKLEQKIQTINKRHGEERAALDVEYEKILSNLEDKEPYTQGELLKLEKEYLGFYLSGHPMDAYRNEVRQRQAVFVTELSQVSTGNVRVAGTISNLKEKTTKKKQLMYSFILEDAAGTVECTVFPQAAALLGPEALQENTCIIINGSLRRHITDDLEKLEIIVNGISPLDAEPETPETIRVLVDLKQFSKEDRYKGMMNVLKSSPGNHPLKFVAIFSTGTALMETKDKLGKVLEINEALRAYPGASGQLVPTDS